MKIALALEGESGYEVLFMCQNFGVNTTRELVAEVMTYALSRLD